jgi:hypothetical protein
MRSSAPLDERFRAKHDRRARFEKLNRASLSTDKRPRAAPSYPSSRTIKTLGNVRLWPIGTSIGPIVSKPDAP